MITHVFDYNENRDAWATIRGYVYQFDLTILAWLYLEDDQKLQLECGEDFDILPWITDSSDKSGRLMAQVKHREKKLTLNSKEAYTAIANFLEHKRNNPSLDLCFLYLTNTITTCEKPSPFEKDRRTRTKPHAINVWEELRTGDYDEEKTRCILEILTSRVNKLEKDFKASEKIEEDKTDWTPFIDFMNKATPEILYEQVISKFEWRTRGIPSGQTRDEIVERLIELGFAENNSVAQLQYHSLFSKVIECLTQRGLKELSIEGRDSTLQIKGIHIYDDTISHAVIRLLANVKTIEHLFRQNEIYHHIDDLFVAPIELDEIVYTLEQYHVVCIVGEPHTGKSFTAVKILLDYYLQGYQIDWFRNDPNLSIRGRYAGSSPSTDSLEHFIDRIEPQKILFLEDPYGETLEDLRYLQGFKLSALLEYVVNHADNSELPPPKLIVTFRNAIWDMVLDRVDPKLIDYQENVKKSITYTPQDYLEILNRYIDFIKPRWANNNEFREHVFESVARQLTAPHNIYFFVESSKNDTNLSQIDNSIRQSTHIVDALVHELSLLDTQKQLVFITVYMTTFRPLIQTWMNSMTRVFFEGRLNRHLVCYREFLNILGYEDEAIQIFTTTIAEWRMIFSFPDIDWQNIDLDNSRIVQVNFRHPSYKEAVSQFIQQNGTGSVFSELGVHISQLVTNPNFRQLGINLIHPFLMHAHSLRSRTIKEIRSLFENGTNAVKAEVVEALLANWHQLPSHLNPVLMELNPNEDKVVWNLFMKAAARNPYLNWEQRIELWHLALGGGALLVDIRELFYGIFHPLDAPIRSLARLPESLQEILLGHLSSEQSWAWYCFGYPLTKNYSRLPTEFQSWVYTLARDGNEFVIVEMIKALRRYYEDLPSEGKALFEIIAGASDWKYRAYLSTYFRERKNILLVEHQNILEQLILRDTDFRVRISPLYTVLQLIGTNQIIETNEIPELHEIPEDLLTQIFSQNSEDEAGVLFSLFHSFDKLSQTNREQQLKERFFELMNSQNPRAIAVIQYSLSQEDKFEDFGFPQFTPGEVDVSQFRDFVDDLVNGLHTIYMGPGR